METITLNCSATQAQKFQSFATVRGESPVRIKSCSPIVMESH